MDTDAWIKTLQVISYLLMGLGQALNVALTLRRWRREKVNHE